MTITPNHKRLAIGLWVLAALLVLWYNAVAFLSLWDRELTAMSPGARNTIAKRQQLESRMAQKLSGLIDPFQINHIAAKIDGPSVAPPPPKPKGGTPSQAVSKKVNSAAEMELKLPSLDGIIAVYQPSKGKTYLAVMDGKTLEEQSRINDFVITSIDAKGVQLARGAKTVFIPAPQIAYSKDKSMEE
jgi:hypothetical protein